MEASNAPSVSIIVPAFNEEGVISHCIGELFDVMKKTYVHAEVIVVDDGSTDQTFLKAKSMQKKFSTLRVLSLSRNHGKAVAMREGVRIAQGKAIALFDADMQYDPADLVKMISVLSNGPDLVTGRRDFRRYDSTRTIFSKLYNRLMRLIFQVDVMDSNCGMKVFRRKTANLDFLFRYGTSLMVPLLKLNGYRIVETPVSLRERETGESKFFDKRRFMGGRKHFKEISYQSGMLLGLLVSLPSELSKSRNSQ